ncbi:MAG: tetratricopeptide repeat protein [Gemmatimonadetes bacterium]|nr:tetratricopeptide repeat protein [Gemmatimonadota bacterium]
MSRRGPGIARRVAATTIRRTICVVFVLAGSASCGDADSAIARGDHFWAEGAYAEALAEYRLALRESRTPTTLSRVAHAYIQNGQFERAREIYDELLGAAPEWADQAVFDYLTVAVRARDRGDRYGLASAVEAARSLRPGLPLDEFAIPLARYYASTGDPAKALDSYERALSSAPPDSVPTLLFDIARMHVSQGNCSEAIGFFRAFRSRERRGPRADEANWHIGECSFNLARRSRQDGDLEKALRELDTTIDLGVPKNRIDEAWFDRGEVLFAMGRRDDALFAYRMVLEINPAGTGQLVERARRRIDDLRFGRERGETGAGAAG